MKSARWSPEQAWQWYLEQSWLCGFNFLPSTAVNSTEMWQAESFDSATIDRELGWAEAAGLNTCRVFVQYLVWQHDPAGQKERMERFLSLADSHGISTMFVLFDDCAFSGKQPYLGRQDDPTPGVHNSGWTPSPGFAATTDQSQWPALEKYVQDVIGRFGDDRRVNVWDLYNEPGNSQRREQSQPLLEAAYTWARAVRPRQPLTSGLWNPTIPTVERASAELSDIISFHAYSDLETTEEIIAHLEDFGRPLICTEWLFRPHDSRFESHLPLFREKQVGWYIWGLVNGKTQTHCAWGSQPGAPEPEIWQHDIFHPDGSYYDQGEIEFVREYIADKGLG